MVAVAAPTPDLLLQRFLALTEAAMRACASQDVTALAGALDARELVSKSLVASGRPGNPGVPLPAATRRLMGDALKGNVVLEAQVAAARDEIRLQLERVTHDEAGVAGYADSAPRTHRVDFTR